MYLKLFNKNLNAEFRKCIEITYILRYDQYMMYLTYTYA